MSEEQAVLKATLPGGSVALFKSVDDFLLYVAQTGTAKQFQQFHKEVTGKSPLAHLYFTLRTGGMRNKFIEMAQQTMCEDGSTMWEALKKISGR